MKIHSLYAFFWLAVCFCGGCCFSGSSDVIRTEVNERTEATLAASRELVNRLLPEHACQITLEIIESERGQDVYEIDVVKDCIVLRGNTPSAIGSALNHYLKYTAKVHFSWGCGDQLNLPETLPLPETIRVVTPYLHRPAYNYCTHGYTMPWWGWDKWERELDFLALNGFNEALIIQGQEQVWINTLTKFGYTEEEVLSWLVMPTHQPWMFMSNMQSYGGPMPKSLVIQRVELAQRMMDRMRELGIRPILQGYYGMVPAGFQSKHPQANIHVQGDWCGLKRPDMLDPTDPLFAQIADVFYAEQAKLYGKLKFLAADPFHEGGSTQGIDLSKCGEGIFNAMQRAQPGVTWVIQAWGGNPRDALIRNLDKSKLLILDLFCEAKTTWKDRKGFQNTPWVWCTIGNFGGNTGLDGRFETYARAPSQALRDPDSGQLCGLGAVPEGSQTNPLIWDLHFENIWRNTPMMNSDSWIHAYAERRYGAVSKPAERAWEFLLQTVYGRPRGGKGGETPFNTVMNARPSLDPNQRARLFAGPPVPTYEDKAEYLFAAWESLIAAGQTCESSEGYRYDLADLTRQVICDAVTRIHGRIVKAYHAGDREQVKILSTQMLSLFDDLDDILATRQEFLLGTWIADARSWGETSAESDLCEWNARTLVTTWTNPSDMLTDYGNRSWAGLVKDFYKQRWAMWFDALNQSLAKGEKIDEKAVRNDIRTWEYTWGKQTVKTYSAEPVGNTLEIAKRIYDKCLSLDPAFFKRK